MKRVEKDVGRSAVGSLIALLFIVGLVACSGDDANGPDTDPEFDYDGELIAFRSNRGGTNNIWLMTPNGSEQINITRSQSNDSDPAWSPDGSRIAFVSTRSGNAELYIMDVDGSGIVQITNNQGSVRFPNWSPDGTMILYSSNVNNQRDLYVIDAPGSGSLMRGHGIADCQLTSNAAVDNEPVWSPDASRIFFYSNRDGDGDVFSVPFDCAIEPTPVNLTQEFDFACAPAIGWSKSDNSYKLSFVGEQDGKRDIWVMDLDGSNKRNVSDHQSEDFYSTWMNSEASLPVGETRLIFDSVRNGQWELYSIRENGTGTIRLTNHDADDQMPRWRP